MHTHSRNVQELSEAQKEWGKKWDAWVKQNEAEDTERPSSASVPGFGFNEDGLVIEEKDIKVYEEAQAKKD